MDTLPRARTGPRAPLASREGSLSRFPRLLKGEAPSTVVQALPGPGPLSSRMCWWGEADSSPATSVSIQVSELWMGLPAELVSSSGKV